MFEKVKSLRVVLLLLAIVLALFVFLPYNEGRFDSKNGLEVHFDDVPCVFCDYFVDLDELKEHYPNLRFAYGENDTEIVNGYENKSLYLDASSMLGIPLQNLGVHMNVVAKKIEINHTTDVNESVNWTVEKIKNGTYLNLSAVVLPFFGEVDVSSLSLAGHAVVLGFADSSNPCALWVLIFLICLIFCVKNLKRLSQLIFTFIICSFVMYALFMLRVFDVFSFTGYFTHLVIIVGVVSAYVGVLAVRESCGKKVVGESSLPLAVFGMFLFAVIISAVEFSCSSLISTIFVAMLDYSGLSSFAYLGYVLLYSLFYLLDDAIILCLALYVASLMGDRKGIRFAAGIVLLLLAVILLFFPNLLI